LAAHQDGRFLAPSRAALYLSGIGGSLAARGRFGVVAAPRNRDRSQEDPTGDVEAALLVAADEVPHAELGKLYIPKGQLRGLLLKIPDLLPETCSLCLSRIADLGWGPPGEDKQGEAVNQDEGGQHRPNASKQLARSDAHNAA
jgi:hypothetical protein